MNDKKSLFSLNSSLMVSPIAAKSRIKSLNEMLLKFKTNMQIHEIYPIQEINHICTENHQNYLKL